MQEGTDNELLQEYVQKGHNEAFSALVGRYVNMVYSTAMRKTGNPSAAEEITQTVFILLAKKANQLRPNIILSGWLYQTTRLTAANFLRTEIRRVCREQEAYMQSHSNEPEVWPQIMPLLEDAMGRLGEKDRNALTLRFFEGKSFDEIGTAFGASENAAKKRVAYALEKLRKYFSRRGVHSTTIAIAGAISIHSVQTAPAALAKTATALALAKGTTASASTLTLIKGALKIMAWSKAKTAILIGVGILTAVGASTVAVTEIHTHRAMAWREKYDPAILGKIPPQVKILPAIPSRPGENWGNTSEGMVGLSIHAIDIIECAYRSSKGRILLTTPLPDATYDFISNPRSDADKALQEEITRHFGLIAHREIIETNALLLTLRNRNAPELKITSNPNGQNNSNRNPFNGSYLCENMPLSDLARFLEDFLQVPVVDQTGLTNRFDIEFIGGSTPEQMKQTVLKEVGLELVPGQAPVELLVVEKAH